MRTITVLVITAVGVLVSLRGDRDVSLREVFRLPVSHGPTSQPSSPSSYDSAVDAPWLRPPPPVVADVDGDGQPDLVLATRHPPTLQVLSYSGDSDDPEDPHSTPVVKAEVSLVTTVAVQRGRRPVALAVGSTSVDDPTALPVIVVVTEEWTVMCFSPTLELLWETAANHLEDRYGPGGGHLYHRELAILITPTSINDGTKGLVVVAGSLDHVHNAERLLRNMVPRVDRELGEAEREADRKRADRMEAEGKKGGGGGDDDGGVDGLSDVEETEESYAAESHFSFYAFDGATGKLQWKHEGIDFDDEVDGEDVLVPQHQYAVSVSNEEHVRQGHRSTGSWRLYRRSVLGVLPHSWTGRDDTLLRVATFRRTRRGRRKEAWSGASAPSPSPPPPNVVVAHGRFGVEAVSLSTGEPMARLTLTTSGTYADLNADGVLDHVFAVAPRNARRQANRIPATVANFAPKCVLQVQSGVPPSHSMFNVTACGATRVPGGGNAYLPPKRRRKKRGVVFAGGDDGLDVEMAAPVVLPIETLRTGAKRYATVVHVSSGWVSAYDDKGTMMWHTHTDSAWLEWQQPDVVTLFPFAPFADEEVNVENGFLLAVGQSFVTVLRAKDGSEVSRRKFPGSTVIGKPVFGDFDGDGVNDALLVTETGVHGLKLKHRQGSWLVFALVMSFVAVLVLVGITIHVTDGADAPSSSSRAAPSRPRRGGHRD